MEDNSRIVIAWWIILSAVGLFNIILWAVNLRWFQKLKASGDSRYFSPRRWQVLLAAGYTFGCAFRSFVPRADVQRICLLDSPISAVVWGRSVATIAELCFVAQWSIILYEMAQDARVEWARLLACLVVPLIFIAEIFSWYATVTTNYLGNSVEESIWAFTSLILIVSLGGVLPAFNEKMRRLIALAICSAIIYFGFMSLVDVPMYLSRWHADQLSGRHYFSIIDGLKDVSSRWVVTRRFEDWKTEIPWMTLYFSAAVWMSISLIRLPRFDREIKS